MYVLVSNYLYEKNRIIFVWMRRNNWSWIDLHFWLYIMFFSIPFSILAGKRLKEIYLQLIYFRIENSLINTHRLLLNWTIMKLQIVLNTPIEIKTNHLNHKLSERNTTYLPHTTISHSNFPPFSRFPSPSSSSLTPHPSSRV